MGIKIANIPITALLSYQQVIELSSREMNEFFDQVVKDQKAGLVSEFYKSQLFKRLGHNIRNNNRITDDIEKEVFRRAVATFGRDVTTSKINSALHAEYNLEKQKVEKEKADRKAEADKIANKRKAPVKPPLGKIKKLDTTVSTEKKVKKTKK